ncbi:signal peptidase I [Planctobacterium marinum]|uniref:signal peptidase I n=1 Tax=Planctobacterium marinum TaxID=1631968 RepID=UPI001E47268F|nr:signal peptidase I [Planctobacterium marinum]MCC2605440.1 signal peptidase I [Planctobacterium marinum]
MLKKLQSVWSNNRVFVLFIALMIVFRSAVADWNHVPTGSMQPSIQIGDQITVDKLAYDVRLPLTHISLQALNEPQPGDVVIFDSQVSDKRLVKRVIATPGDQVAMRNNQLIINGSPLRYDTLKEEGNIQILTEHLHGTKHTIQIRKNPSKWANFTEVTVPANHFLVLGDNRDNSADSRAIGFVPRHEIVGKAETVAFSLDYDHYYLPRLNRIITPIDKI